MKSFLDKEHYMFCWLMTLDKVYSILEGQKDTDHITVVEYGSNIYLLMNPLTPEQVHKDMMEVYPELTIAEPITSIERGYKKISFKNKFTKSV